MMACGAAGRALSYPNESFLLEHSSLFGASASVEVDAEQKRPSELFPKEVPVPTKGLPASSVSCDLPLIPFSSPERSPAASSILAPPSGMAPEALPPLLPHPWVLQPPGPSKWYGNRPLGDALGQGSSPMTDARPSWMSCNRAGHLGEQEVQRPDSAAPSFEDDSSDSSVSVDGMMMPPATCTKRERVLLTDELAHCETTDLLRSSMMSFPWSAAASQPVAGQPRLYSAQGGVGVQLRSATDPKSSTHGSHSWAASSEDKAAEALQASQGHSPGAFRGQVASCSQDGSSPPSYKIFGDLGNSGGATSGGPGATAVKHKKHLPCFESVDDAEDGRAWLDLLEKLRGGASREEYKRARARVVDQLIRRAASYPKVSGIYFDKHQLRWSVGWALHGRRQAKYFPIKLFGMREGYGMAVRFKYAKAAGIEDGGCPFLTNPGEPKEIAGTSEQESSHASELGAPEKMPLPSMTVGTIRFASGSRIRLPVQQQASSSSRPLSPTHAWNNHIPLSRLAYQEAPPRGLAPSDSNISSAGRVEHSSGSCTEKLPPRLANSGQLAYPWQSILPSARGEKEEADRASADAQAVRISTPELAGSPFLPTGVLCSSTFQAGWTPTAVAPVDQPGLWGQEHLGENVRVSDRNGEAHVLHPLRTHDMRYSNSTQGSLLSSDSGALVPSPLISHQEFQDPAQGKGNHVLFSLRAQQNSSGLDTSGLVHPTDKKASNQQYLVDKNYVVAIGSLSSSEAKCMEKEACGPCGYRTVTTQSSTQVPISPISSNESVYCVSRRSACSASSTCGAVVPRASGPVSAQASSPGWSGLEPHVSGELSASRDVAPIKFADEMERAIRKPGSTHGMNNPIELSVASCISEKSPSDFRSCFSCSDIAAVKGATSAPYSGLHERDSTPHLFEPLERVHHTTGIHFDKHSRRWKSTWYDNLGQRKAKYFPVGRYGFENARLLAIETRLSNHVPRGSRCKEAANIQECPIRAQQPAEASLSLGGVVGTPPMGECQFLLRKQITESDPYHVDLPEVKRVENASAVQVSVPQCEGGGASRTTKVTGRAERTELCGLDALVEDGYDEEADRRLARESSRALIRHASQLRRVPGIWFDKKQLRWACTFTDMELGKRRAEYFPIRHFGFMGARLLAVNARRRMERCRSQTFKSGRAHMHQKERAGGNEIRRTSRGTENSMTGSAERENVETQDSAINDIWNNYVAEAIQGRVSSKAAATFCCTDDEPFLALPSSRAVVADNRVPSKSEKPQVDGSASPINPTSECEEAEESQPTTTENEEEAVGSDLQSESDNLLSLEREAIRFLLCDLRTHCLTTLAPGFSPTNAVIHMAKLQRHALWVEQAEQCQSLEQYLIIFADCIKRMKLPSHLCQAEQCRLLQRVAALDIPNVDC